MTDITTTAAPAVPLPSQEEIDAALRTLTRAWNPGVLLPGDPGYDNADDYDPDEHCNCAGDNEYGESRGCNCGDGCVCDSCQQFRHTRAKTCDASPYNTGLETHCGRPTRYRVVGFRLNDLWTGNPEGGECPHTSEDDCPCANGAVFTKYGAKPDTHQTLTACSIEHAQALVARMRDAYNEPADKANRLRWYFEPWKYVPHYNELPAPLAALREHIDGARVCIRAAVEGITDRGDAGPWPGYARKDLARAVWNAAQPLEWPDEDDGTADDDLPGPVKEEPADPWDTDAADARE